MDIKQQQIDKAAYQQGMAQQATIVLENQAYIEAMRTLKDAIYKKWSQCSIRDPETQKELLQMFRMAESFEQILNGMVMTGNFAEKTLDRLNREDNFASKVRQFIRKI
jgi:hypothetical protein